ncbi:hypothetical protein [Burkholderia glumae]|uniref:hypothetical protein n=1 Tax=Burkholderia glumae TaxID=337 RepID=UPI002150D85A|nr:hypothetical protein [Burkholderia glumae]UVS96357.1 hypothetical protein EFP19_11755 [Burkholderia glumae]
MPIQYDTAKFDEERATLNAELTAVALSGGNTESVRAKFAKLEAREADARYAAQDAYQERIKERELESVREASEMATAAVFRISEAGFTPSEDDAQLLAMRAADVVRHDAQISMAQEARDEAFGHAMTIATRLKLMTDRQQALQDLRLTGVDTPRDTAEAAVLVQDIETVSGAYARAHATAVATVVPADLVEYRKRALAAFHEAERGIVFRMHDERIEAAEHAILDFVRAKMAFAGVRTAAGLHKRSPAFDQYIRFGAL